MAVYLSLNLVVAVIMNAINARVTRDAALAASDSDGCPDRIALAPAHLFGRARAPLRRRPGASLVTVVVLAALAWAGWHLLEWGVIGAVTAPEYAACKAAQGACWGFVAEKWRLILFGRYPYEGAMAACARHRRGAGDAGRERAAGALVAARGAHSPSRLGDRLRRVLHADVRRRSASSRSAPTAGAVCR
jgi:hypothetical protein